MANGKPTAEELKAYREWYKSLEGYTPIPSVRTEGGKTVWSSPYERNWETNQYYQYWLTNVKSASVSVAPTETEKYLDTLEKYLVALVSVGMLTKEEARDTYFDTKESIEKKQIAQQAQIAKGEAPDSVIDRSLPFYWEFTEGVTPEQVAEQAQTAKQEATISEVAPGLRMSQTGKYYNAAGDEVSKEVAQFMMKTAGGGKVAGQLRPPVTQQARQEASQLGRIGAKTQWLTQQERAWEQAKAGQLAGLQEPADWIKRFMVERTQQPIKPWDYPKFWGDQTPQERAAKLLFGSMAYRPDFAMRPPYEAGYSLSTMGDYEKALAAQKAGYYATGGETLPPIERGPYPVAFGATEAADWQTLQAQPGMTGGPPPTAKTPPAPDWITRYVPALRAGKPIFAAPMKIPSGQQWATIKDTTQEQMLRGYVDWASTQGRWRGMEGEGGRKAQEAIPRLSWEDIMAQVELMRPAGGRGVRGYAPIRRR